MTTSVNSDSPGSLESTNVFQDCAATELTVAAKVNTTTKVEDRDSDHEGDRCSSVTSTMSSKARIKMMKKTLERSLFGPGVDHSKLSKDDLLKIVQECKDIADDDVTTPERSQEKIANEILFEKAGLSNASLWQNQSKNDKDKMDDEEDAKQLKYPNLPRKR